jgi:hypothetical protein
MATADQDIPSNSLIRLCNFDSALAELPFALWEVALQPWWIILVSATFCTLASYSWHWTLVRTRIGRALTERFEGVCSPGQQLQRQDSESSIGPHESRHRSHTRFTGVRDHIDSILREHAATLSDAVSDGAVAYTLQPAPSFMILQLAIQLAHAIYILATLHGGQTAWRRYEELYARFLNGGGAMLLLPCFYSSITASGAPKASLPHGYSYALNFYFVALCPILITHCCLIYVFIPLTLLLVLTACVGFSPKLLRVAVKWCGPKVMLLACVALQCVAITLVQSSVVNGIQFYDGVSYLDCLHNEYLLRDTRCWFAALRERISPMIFSVVSLI